MARILVIDDEHKLRQMLCRALEAAGHVVVEARDGAEGIRLYRAAPTDLVITDILMPEMDGLGCIRELRKSHPGVRVIAISGGSPKVTMDALGVARAFGACRTLQKPFDLDQLLKAVHEELGGRSAA